MIIECQACHSRFRLDESKIKGKGARVRCRRCGEAILVMKEDAAAAPGETAAVIPAPGQFDINFAVEESLGREPSFPAPPPFEPETPFREEPPFAADIPVPEPAVPFEAASPFEPETQPWPVPAGPAETAADAEGAALEFPSQSGPGDDFLDLGLLAAAESPSAQPSEPVEPAFATADWPPADDAASAPYESGIDPFAAPSPLPDAELPPGILSGGATEAPQEGRTSAADLDEVDLAFEQFLAGTEDAGPKAGASPPPSPFLPDAPPDDVFGRIDLTSPPEPILSAEPAFAAEPSPDRDGSAGFLMNDADSLDFLQSEAPGSRPVPDGGPEAGREPFAFQLDEEAMAVPEAPAASTFPEEPARSFESNAAGMPEETPQAASQPVRPPLPQEFPVQKSAIRDSRPASPRAPAIRPGVAVAGILFLLLAAGGGYLGFTSGGRDTLRALVPALGPLLGNDNAAGKTGASLDVRNLIGYYDNTSKAGRMFVIKGQVTNMGSASKGRIRIHAALLDASNRTLAEKSVYAGNVLGGEALRVADKETIEATLSSPFGEKLANLDIAPGKSVPFMVVFLDIPDGIDAYRLEAKEGD